MDAFFPPFFDRNSQFIRYPLTKFVFFEPFLIDDFFFKILTKLIFFGDHFTKLKIFLSPNFRIDNQFLKLFGTDCFKFSENSKQNHSIPLHSVYLSLNVLFIYVYLTFLFRHVFNLENDILSIFIK